MTKAEIILRRLINQQLYEPRFTDAAGLVGWMGCIQAQDFAGAKWAIGSRLQNPAEASILQAFQDGRILRTHVLRPTWHFVLPEDIYWMQELTAHRVKAFCAGAERKLELNAAVFKRSHAALKKALRGGQQLDRRELASVLDKAGIRTDENRFTHLLMQAELDGVICSGPVIGKQFTYTLLEELAPAILPKGKFRSREEGLGELTRRYFCSRGPATLGDFAWWSGLTLADARLGMEINVSFFEKENVDGETYWFDPSFDSGRTSPSKRIIALPAFDEYTIAYADRDLVVDPKQADRSGKGIFKPILVHEGQVVGNWQRTIKKDHMEIVTDLFKPIGKRLIRTAFEAYGRFMEKELVIS
ncbi:winged helix DNA-binding domain-containing protein [Flavitalea flava]